METVMDTKQNISDLSDLIELEYDAIAAYRSAIERLDNAAYKLQLTEFLGDHVRHVEDLSNVVRQEGGNPPTEGDFKQILTQGKVVLAGLIGDEAIRKAMKANEVVTNTTYEKAVDTGYAEHIQALLRGGLADERRHKDWIEKTLATL
ncbi:DUF2383 domain-containing protein [Nitrincola sp.]|uniref:DUF2383 domain-containing protein n=1 Tax=Nitrincola sp. TaxID=1926584 RepID=UPI003A8CFF71